MRILIAVMAAVTIAGASPALAQTSEDWTAFTEETLARYGDPGDSPDWEDLLYAAGTAHPDDPEAALDAFAAAIGRPRDEASRHAHSIMRMVALMERCRYEACARVDPAVIKPPLLAEAAREPAGALLTVVGKHILDADVMAAIRAHPARLRVLSDIYAYTETEPLLALMVLEAPAAPEVLAALRAKPPQVGSDQDTWDGWLLAILEEAQAQLVRDSAEVEAQAAYAQIILSHALQLGLTEHAVTTWRAMSPALRDALPLIPPEGCGVPVINPEAPRLPDDICEDRDRGAEFVAELAAALWTAGDPAAAEALMAQGEIRLGGAGLMGQAYAAVVDALRRERSPDSLFDLYVDGDRTLSMPQYAGLDGHGWMNVGYGPAGQRVVADRARTAGYASIAEAIEARAPYYRGGYKQPTLAPMADALPAPVRQRQAALGPAIEAAWATFPDLPDHRPGGGGVVPAAWTESRLPEGLSAWQEPARQPGFDEPDMAEEDALEAGEDDDSRDAAAATAADAAEAAEAAADAAEQMAVSVATIEAMAGLDPESAEEAYPSFEEETDSTLPIPPYAVVRLDESANERLLIYRDSTYDLPGETGAYGLWFNRSVDGVWGEPVYLGLQENFPYVVIPNSELPLLDGDKLQIEVRVREIDPGSITFPPVGLRLKREEDGVVLTASLAELTRDDDADGLPDLVERRLNLDATNPDIDGDGVPDGTDPLPQVARNRAAPPARMALAHAILKQVMGYDAAALVVPVSAPGESLDDMVVSAIGRPPVPASFDTFIVGGDPTLFAGLDLPFRLLVYTPEALRALSERGAPFYPPTVTIYSSLDGRRHYVVWSASWVGGSFIAVCNDGAAACEIEERTSWIT